MAEQLFLRGMSKVRERSDNLFFAIRPEGPVATRIANQARAARADHKLEGVLLTPGRLHISLHHIGLFAGIPEGEKARACAAGCEVSRHTIPFEVEFDQLLSFRGRPGNHPLVLCGSSRSEALLDFHQRLGKAMLKAGLRPQASAHFSPHLTLLYDRRRVTPQAIAPIRWTVREFVLIHSLIGKRRHILLDSFPFHREEP